MSFKHPPHSSTIGHSSRFAALALALSITAAACATGTPRAASDAREAPAPGTLLVDGRPGEPLPDPSTAREVSLGSVLAFADQSSPVLKVARSTRSRAEAARAAAAVIAAANPELTVAVGPRTGGGATALDLQVGVMQELQVGGERGARMRAAERLKELTDAEIEQVRWSVHCDVHAAFHRALVEQKRLELAESVEKFQKEILRVAERQVAAGESAPLGLRLARAEVAQSQQSVVLARQALTTSRIRLALLSGWPIATPPRPGGRVDEIRLPPELPRLLAVSREHLPSLRASVARVKEAEARAELADREGSVRPSVGVQYTREGGPAGEATYHVLLGVVSLPVPLFQRNQGERARARSDAVVARAEGAATRQILEGQVAEARVEVAAAAERARTYGREILPRFEENLTMLRRAFELGEIDILALSSGRERFLRIQSDALGSELDYFVSLSNLERLVGMDLWHDDHPAGATP